MHINTQSPALANLDSYTKPRPFPEDTPQEKNIQQNQIAYAEPHGPEGTKVGSNAFKHQQPTLDQPRFGEPNTTKPAG